MRTLAGPDRIAKFFSASDLKDFYVEMWQNTKETKVSLTNVSRVLPKIISKYGHLQIERRHEFCNPDTILVFIIIGAETRPCVVSRDPTFLFYFQVCLLSFLSLKRPLYIWLLTLFFLLKATFVFGTSEKVKFASTLMLPDSKRI